MFLVLHNLLLRYILGDPPVTLKDLEAAPLFGCTLQTRLYEVHKLHTYCFREGIFKLADPLLSLSPTIRLKWRLAYDKLISEDAQ